MKKRLSFILVALYLFPWGMQVLVDNFISVYTASLPFATPKTVGEVAAIGAVVTMISQLLWTRAAGRIGDKRNALMLSLILLAFFSVVFLVVDVTKPLLFLLVILFYSCYMTHQPLIDTISSDNYVKTGRPFGWFRSFASFGYASMGFLFAFLPNEGNTFFAYVAVLAVISAVFSGMISSPNKHHEVKTSGGKYMNKKFACFLIFSFFLFMCSRTIASFFSAYYCDVDSGLGGDIGILSLIISLGTFGEWAVMLAFGKVIEKMRFKYIFLIIAVSGIFRSGVIYLVENPYVVSLTVVFSAVWYGFLWSSATPYIKKIVPEDGFASAQGVWTVVSFGIAPFVGSYIGGIFAEMFGYQTLFLAISIVMAGLAVVTPLLIKE